MEQKNNGAVVATILRGSRKPIQLVDYSQLSEEQTEQMFSFAEPKPTEEKPEIT